MCWSDEQNKYDAGMRQLVMLIVVVCIPILCVVLLFSITTFVVSGASMQPLLASGDVLIVNKVILKLTNPERGDLLVFKSPINPQQQLVKRVIGLPSETVVMTDGLIFIDGLSLDETYNTIHCNPASCPNGIWQLDDNEYFLMGDNRNISADSRGFGAVTRDFLVGKVYLFQLFHP